MEIAQQRTEVNGVDYAYLQAGPDDGPLALCVHGFPDTAWTFRHLLPGLADAGFRAVAPFMRGYAPTAVPGDGQFGVGAWTNDALAFRDLLGGGSPSVIVGHDWGAAVAYAAAGADGEGWSRVVGMAVPPGGAMGRAFLTYDQLKRSWYMFYFQTPLADVVVPMNELEFIARLWADWSPGYDATDDLVHVREALGDPANLAAALGTYRNMFGGGGGGGGRSGPLTQPTLYLHGSNDGCIGVGLTEGLSGSLPEGSEVVVVDGVGHFLHLEEPQAVNARILDFLRR